MEIKAKTFEGEKAIRLAERFGITVVGFPCGKNSHDITKRNLGEFVRVPTRIAKQALKFGADPKSFFLVGVETIEEAKAIVLECYEYELREANHTQGFIHEVVEGFLDGELADKAAIELCREGKLLRTESSQAKLGYHEYCLPSYVLV